MQDLLVLGKPSIKFRINKKPPEGGLILRIIQFIKLGTTFCSILSVNISCAVHMPVSAVRVLVIVFVATLLFPSIGQEITPAPVVELAVAVRRPQLPVATADKPTSAGAAMSLPSFQ